MQSTAEERPKDKPKDIVVAFKLSRKVHAKLLRVAKSEDRSLASVLRGLLAQAVQ